MNATLKHTPLRFLPIVVVRWLARIATLASLGLLALFATSGGGWPSAFEGLLLAFFPVGVALGMVVGWWRETLGGVITLVSLVTFHALMFVRDGHIPATPWFAVFALPGIVFLVLGLIDARSARQVTPN